MGHPVVFHYIGTRRTFTISQLPDVILRLNDSEVFHDDTLLGINDA